MAYMTATAVKSKYAVLTDDDLDTIEAAIAEFEQIAEAYRGVAYEPRENTVTLRGSGLDGLLLPHPLVSEVETVTVDGTAVTDFVLWGDDGILTGYCWTSGAQVVVTYTHGHAEVPQPGGGR